MSAPTDEQPRWTAWGDRLVALLAVGAVISFAAVWIMQYANVDGNPGLIERISYTVVDPTWMPPGVTRQEPLVGLHYFGDMWYHVAYGEAQTPYILAGRPAQYPPIAIYVFKLWGLFGYPVALAIMTVLNLGLIGTLAWRLVGHIPGSRKAIIVIFTAVITTPMIVTLDRGGHQYIAVGLLAWALWNYHRGRAWWAVLLIVIAISLKTYLAFFLIYPLVRGHVRFVFQTALIGIGVNAILFVTFPGKATISFGGFLTSTLQFSNAVNFDIIFNGSSLTGLLFHVIELSQGTLAATEVFFEFERFLSLPGLAWLALVALLSASRRIPYWASMTLALSTAAMAIPAAWPYNFASMSLAALYFGLNNMDPFPSRWSRHTSSSLAQVPSWAHAAMRLLVLLAVCGALIPQFGRVTGASGSTLMSYSIVAPASTLLCGLGLLITLAAMAAMKGDSLRVRGRTHGATKLDS